MPKTLPDECSACGIEACRTREHKVYAVSGGQLCLRCLVAEHKRLREQRVKLREALSVIRDKAGSNTTGVCPYPDVYQDHGHAGIFAWSDRAIRDTESLA